jgi:hypothetical protein
MKWLETVEERRALFQGKTVARSHYAEGENSNRAVGEFFGMVMEM